MSLGEWLQGFQPGIKDGHVELQVCRRQRRCRWGLGKVTQSFRVGLKARDYRWVWREASGVRLCSREGRVVFAHTRKRKWVSEGNWELPGMITHEAC